MRDYLKQLPACFIYGLEKFLPTKDISTFEGFGYQPFWKKNYIRYFFKLLQKNYGEFPAMVNWMRIFGSTANKNSV